jgi:hypothetical protein
MPIYSSSGYLQYFRSNLSDLDIQNDAILGVGTFGLISIKKVKFGEAIRPLSFTASTSAIDFNDSNKTLGFKDSFSGDESFGVLVDTVSGLSAGIIFYDIGVAIIHGPTSGYASAISALTSVSFYSTMKMWQYNFFCTVNPNQLNWTNNPNSFYARNVVPAFYSTISGDPDDLGMDTSATSSISSMWYNWGDSPDGTTWAKGDYHLSGMWKREPYITTIGLYGENNDLLAVAKLSQPIRKPVSYPITFRIQLDLQ